jgi:hypothetical protein
VQVRRGINLVYGGGSIGLMGVIARTVRDGGCHVLGYPAALAASTFFFVCVTCTLFEYLMFWSWFSCLLLICSFIHRVIPKALMPIEVCGFSSLQDLFMVW